MASYTCLCVGMLLLCMCIPPLRLKSLYMTLRQHCQPLALRDIKKMLRIFFIWVDKVDVSCKMISTPGEVSTLTMLYDVQSSQPGLQCAARFAMRRPVCNAPPGFNAPPYLRNAIASAACWQP